MARTREFKPDDALEAAMQVFWKKGFGDTSIDDLVEATGVSRYGLYSLYGDKHGLFLAVLDRYRDCQASAILSQLEARDASRPAVEGFFRTFAAAARNKASARGCLFANTAIEFGTSDKEVARRITGHFRRLESAFLTALARAKKKGEVAKTFDETSAAVMLAGIAQGMLVMLRAGEPAKKIEIFAEGALATLN